jgi:hypothetical protein
MSPNSTAATQVYTTCTLLAQYNPLRGECHKGGTVSSTGLSNSKYDYNQNTIKKSSLFTTVNWKYAQQQFVEAAIQRGFFEVLYTLQTTELRNSVQIFFTVIDDEGMLINLEFSTSAI